MAKQGSSRLRCLSTVHPNGNNILSARAVCLIDIILAQTEAVRRQLGPAHIVNKPSPPAAWQPWQLHDWPVALASSVRVLAPQATRVNGMLGPPPTHISADGTPQETRRAGGGETG
ncbi:hypothetical protein FDECE_11777 [Fusarium decemcellulare]|nr:hypothetical protein FDECE_11777 [Fusarium decemcellulare]